MNTHFSLQEHNLYLWRAFLPALLPQLGLFLSVLSPDEVARANRFRFAEHRERFIIARGVLRHILSLYTKVPPDDIQFSYAEHGKPYLQPNPSHLFFNVSHSHDMAVYGFALNKEIGIDIEKIGSEFNMDIAKRFFNREEFLHLLALPENEQAAAFYAIWACKEALIKALGTGLYTPLHHFSSLTAITNEDTKEPSKNKQASKEVYEQGTFRLGKDPTGKMSAPEAATRLKPSFSHNLVTIEGDQAHSFYVSRFAAHPAYQAAFAIVPPMGDIHFWEWVPQGPLRWG